MRTIVVIAAVTALMMGMLIISATGGFADEPVNLTGEIKEVNFEGSRVQIIPTDKGILMVLGELVKGQPANVLLFEGARPAQITMTPHTHTEVMMLHRELEEELKDFIEKNVKSQGD